MEMLPGFLYADFFFGFENNRMRKKISKAIIKLNEGLKVTIKAHDNYIERAILMSEILKKRVGLLFQETKFIKIKKPRSSDGN